MAPAVARANEQLRLASAPPLPEGLTPHSLRRTFASIPVALGEYPAYVMAEMGHADPKLTLSVYAREMRRKDGERERLRALVEGTADPKLGAAAPSTRTIAAFGASASLRRTL